jgi:hypothetical protein
MVIMAIVIARMQTPPIVAVSTIRERLIGLLGLKSVGPADRAVVVEDMMWDLANSPSRDCCGTVAWPNWPSDGNKTKTLLNVT